MAMDILLPVLGESIAEATVLRWLKQVGEPVKRGETILEIETAKAALDIESPADGVLGQILASEGTTVTTGQRLGTIRLPGEPEGAPGLPRSAPAGSAEEVRAEAPFAKPAGSAPSRRVSPAARNMARKLGVDLEAVQPGTPGGRITTKDIEAALSGQPKAESAPAWHPVRLSETQKTVAHRMTESAQTIPQFSVSLEVEADALIRAIGALNADHGLPAHISVTVLLAYLTGRAALKHPLINASYQGETIQVFDTVNLAIAVSTSRGLVAPTVYCVERETLSRIALRISDVAERAKNNTLRLSDLSHSTLTLSNLGMRGVTQFIPLINPPQAAILGVGAIRPAYLPATDGGIRKGSLMSLSLGGDHRVFDGAEAAAFLEEMRAQVENCQPSQIDL